MANASPQQSNNTAAGTLDFVTELAKYYMDFLETDFHRRREPKRSIRFRNASNLLVGINLARYPGFSQNAWKLIRAAFKKDTLEALPKGAYRTTIPTPVLELIRLEIGKISDDQLTAVRNAIGQDVFESAQGNAADYEKALSDALERTSKRI